MTWYDGWSFTEIRFLCWHFILIIIQNWSEAVLSDTICAARKTHWSLLAPKHVYELGQHWSKYRLTACLVPNNYQSQCWLVVKWTVKNIFSETWLEINKVAYKCIIKKLKPAKRWPFWFLSYHVVLIVSQGCWSPSDLSMHFKMWPPWYYYWQIRNEEVFVPLNQQFTYSGIEIVI